MSGCLSKAQVQEILRVVKGSISNGQDLEIRSLRGHSLTHVLAEDAKNAAVAAMFIMAAGTVEMGIDARGLDADDLGRFDVLEAAAQEPERVVEALGDKAEPLAQLISIVRILQGAGSSGRLAERARRWDPCLLGKIARASGIPISSECLRAANRLVHVLASDLTDAEVTLVAKDATFSLRDVWDHPDLFRDVNITVPHNVCAEVFPPLAVTECLNLWCEGRGMFLIAFHDASGYVGRVGEDAVGLPAAQEKTLTLSRRLRVKDNHEGIHSAWTDPSSVLRTRYERMTSSFIEPSPGFLREVASVANPAYALWCELASHA